MRSASQTYLRPLAVGACVCLLGAGAAGCSTTQEKAEHQKAKAEHIIKAQEAKAKQEQKKQKEKHHKKHKNQGKSKGEK